MYAKSGQSVTVVLRSKLNERERSQRRRQDSISILPKKKLLVVISYQRDSRNASEDHGPGRSLRRPWKLGIRIATWPTTYQERHACFVKKAWESLLRDKCRALLERVDPRIKFQEKR